MPPQDVESKGFAVEQEVATQPDNEIVDSKQHLTLKLDPHGFPLRPQPSDDPLGKQITYRVTFGIDHPLNWSRKWKVATLLQVSFLSFLGPFTQGYINPAYAPLAKYMHITITEASYNTTIPMVTSGAIGLLLSPISNIYGRRPIYIFVSIIGIVAGAGAAISKTWGTLIVSRVFVGIGVAPGLAIGASAVSDMFFMHERGKYMGVYVIAVTNGAHIAALCGGFTAQQLSWRWSYWVPCITLAVSWLINCFCLPETLCHRDPVTRQPIRRNKSRLALFTFRSTSHGRRIKLWDITHCFLMLKYPSVFFCFIYYAFAFGIGTILFAVTSAAAFGQIYHFNVAQVGMAMGLSTTIGSVIGEFASGPVSDRILYLFMKRHDGVVSSEARLAATWPGAFLLPAGIIIEGVCLEYKTHWSGPVLGIGIASFGLQIVSTNIYAYLADCYTPQNAEISVLLNFGRTSAFPFTLGFFMLPFAKATNFGVAWSVMALISVLLYGGIVLLMWKGKSWREKLGSPNFDRHL